MKAPSSKNRLPFDNNYWKTMYADDDESVIDGLYNAKEHAEYIKSIFRLQDTEVHSLGDFGFGLGALLQETSLALNVSRIVALDISIDCVNRLMKQSWHSKKDIAILNASIEDYESPYLEKHPLDLIIFNSVMQYIPDRSVKSVFKKLSKYCKYLYFCAPTDKDYDLMKEVMDFTDPYAYSRPLSFYRKSWKQYFTAVGLNLLESRSNVKDSPFVFELYRY